MKLRDDRRCRMKDGKLQCGRDQVRREGNWTGAPVHKHWKLDDYGAGKALSCHRHAVLDLNIHACVDDSPVALHQSPPFRFYRLPTSRSDNHRFYADSLHPELPD
jgi:hypothetical protein